MELELLSALFQATTLILIVASYFYIKFLRFNQKFDDKVRIIGEGRGGRSWRPLEALEANFELRQGFGVSIFSVAFFVESLEPLEEEALKTALSRIAAANPMLRMRIDGDVDGDVLYFEEMEEFRPDVEVLETADWQSLMEDEIGKPFHSSVGPLWRVKLLKGDVEGETHRRVLIMTFHHAIVDGKSAMGIGDRLMDELSGENVAKWKTDYEGKMPPSYVEFLGEKIDLSRWEKLGLYLRSKLGGQFDIIPKTRPCSFVELVALNDEKSKKPIRFRSKFFTIELNAEDLDELLRRCRFHGCKLHGALQAVVSLAQVEMVNRNKFKGSQLPDFLSINNYYAESTRGLADETLTWSVVGFHALGRTMTKNVHSNPEKFKQKFWTLAKTISDEVHARRRENPVESFFKIGECLYRFLPKVWRKGIDRLTPKNFRPEEIYIDFFVSNWGKFFEERVDSRVFEVVAARSAANISYSGFCFSHSVVSVRGKLFWTINFCESIFSDEEGRIYVDCVKEALSKVVAGKLA